MVIESTHRARFSVKYGGSPVTSSSNLSGETSNPAAATSRAASIHHSPASILRLPVQLIGVDLHVPSDQGFLVPEGCVCRRICQGPAGSAHGRPVDMPTGGHPFCPVVAICSARDQFPSGLTPFPRVAWVRRIESPVVMTTWAWCMRRSTVALAMVLGISSSNPAGCRLEDRAIERFS